MDSLIIETGYFKSHKNVDWMQAILPQQPAVVTLSGFVSLNYQREEHPFALHPGKVGNK